MIIKFTKKTKNKKQKEKREERALNKFVFVCTTLYQGMVVILVPIIKTLDIFLFELSISVFHPRINYQTVDGWTKIGITVASLVANCLAKLLFTLIILLVNSLLLLLLFLYLYQMIKCTSCIHWHLPLFAYFQLYTTTYRGHFYACLGRKKRTRVVT